MSFGLRQSFGRLCKAEMARRDMADVEIELFTLKSELETELTKLQELEDMEYLTQWQPDPQSRLQ